MSQTTTTRLLKYPHAAVFDPSPVPELALRLRNPAGLVWEVADATLRLAVAPLGWDGSQTFSGQYDWGTTQRSYSLTDKTVGELADELRADGHEIAFENADLAQRGAHVLIAGSGDQNASNGDHLQAYTSLMWCLFDAYAVEVDAARYQVGQALRQMVMTQAEGEWLDVWANLYGVPRRGGETNAALQARIPKEVFRLRVNGLAIEQAVDDVAGQSVTIDEPWKRMFHLSGSTLSGPDHLQDGRYYTYHVIQPVGAEGTDWSLAYPVLERNKAAGIEIAAPRIDFPAWEVTVQPPVEYRIERGLAEYRGSGIYGTQDQILGVMRLSDNEITINHPVARLDWWAVPSEPVVEYDGGHSYNGETSYGDPTDALHIGLRTHQQIEPHRTIAMANVILSDGEALGEENVILSRGVERVTFDPEPIPSDLMYLSGYDAARTVERVEAVSTQAHMLDAASTFTADPGDVGQTDTTGHTSNEAYPLRYWISADNQAFDGSAGYDNTVGYTGWNTDTPTPTLWDAQRWVPEWRVAGLAITNTSL